jgi:hypothetical protein
MNGRAVTTPGALMTPVRVATVTEERLFCVSEQVPFEKLDEALGRLIPLLDAARAEAGLAAAHLMVFRYFPAETERLWQLDVGVQVTPLDWVRPAGEARIVTLPAIRCAGIILWGGSADVARAYEVLAQAVEAEGFVAEGESREWNLHFQGDDSDDTVLLIQREVREA